MPATKPPRDIWIDVEDLFEYAVSQSRPSGIQRVAFEIYRALVAEGAPMPRFCRYDRAGRSMREVRWAAVEELFARLTARDAAAVSPLGALDLTGPPAFLDPPALPDPSLKWGTW